MKNTSLVINVRSQPYRQGYRKQKKALIIQGGYQGHIPKKLQRFSQDYCGKKTLRWKFRIHWIVCLTEIN